MPQKLLEDPKDLCSFREHSGTAYPYRWHWSNLTGPIRLSVLIARVSLDLDGEAYGGGLPADRGREVPVEGIRGGFHPPVRACVCVCVCVYVCARRCVDIRGRVVM
jgi:hypothetical protein